MTPLFMRPTIQQSPQARCIVVGLTPASADSDALRRIAFYLLWCFVFAIPWENVLHVSGVGTISRLLGMIGFGVAMLACFSKMRRLHKLHIPVFAFALWMTATLAWSISTAATTIKVLSLWQLMAMVWLLWQFAEHKVDQSLFLKAYVLGAQVSSFSTVLNYLRGTTYADHSRFVAGAYNPNELGLTIALSVPMALYLGNQSRGMATLYYRLHPAIAATAIVLTGSRGAFLAFMISTTYLLLSMPHIRPSHRLGLLACAGVAIAVLMSIIPAASWKRLGTIQSEVSHGSLTMRRTIWKAALIVYEQHPVKGLGAGALPKAVGPLLGRELVAHNTFLSILVEGGMIGLASFIALLVVLIFAAFGMGGAERSLWIVLLMTWAVGVNAATWEYLKPTWFMFGLLIAQAAHAEFLKGIRSAAQAAIVPPNQYVPGFSR
jgi:O-antigen ligase